MPHSRWLVRLVKDFTAKQHGQETMTANLQVRLRHGVALAQAERAKPLVNQSSRLSILLGAVDRVGEIALAKLQPELVMEPGLRKSGPGMRGRQVLTGIRLHLTDAHRLRHGVVGEKLMAEGELRERLRTTDYGTTGFCPRRWAPVFRWFEAQQEFGGCS